MNNLDISKFSVAKPCPVGWDTMRGNDRERICDMCERSVYNIAAMTPAEVKKLAARASSERICVKLYRRADDTVMTRDCPVGLRAYRKRVAKFAGTALSLVLGLFSAGYGQSNDRKVDEPVAAPRRENQAKQGYSLKGVVTDVSGAVITGAVLELSLEGDKKIIRGRTPDNGEYLFDGLKAGAYRLTVRAKYFKNMVIEGIEIGDEPEKERNIGLELKDSTVVVGIFLEEPMIDTTVPGGRTVIKIDGD